MRNPIPLFVASILAITAVLADDKDKSADVTFKALDRDNDERISKAEAAGDQMVKDHFAMIDADGDGYITKREYSAHLKEMQSPKKEY